MNDKEFKRMYREMKRREFAASGGPAPLFILIGLGMFLVLLLLLFLLLI